MTVIDLKLVASEAPALFFALDVDGNLILITGGELERMGLKDPAVRGGAALRLQNLPISKSHFQRALAGAEYSANITIKGIIFETFFRPMRASNGAIVGVACLAIDVTKGIQVEQQLNDERLKAMSAQKAIAAKTRKILDHIEQGILTFDATLAIEPEFSTFLTKLFKVGPEEIVGAKVVDLLFRNSNLSGDNKATLNEILKLVLNSNLIAWELNGAHAPSETTIRVQGEEKIIALDWQPMVEDSDEIMGMMLSVRDLSKERALEAEVFEQKRRNERVTQIIGELIISSRENMKTFFWEAGLKVAHLLELKNQAFDPVPIMYDLHSIKGTSRWFMLGGIAELAHGVEVVIRELGHKESPDPSHIWQLIDGLVAEIEAYKEVFFTILGGEAVNASRGPSSLLAFVGQVKPILQKSLREVGLTLGGIRCTDSVVKWKPEFFRVLTTILTHVLNNAIDHGYVFPKVRGVLDRPAHIGISAAAFGDQVMIVVEDEGGGLDLARLEQVARDRGVYDQFFNDLSELVFLEGVSSAEKVTVSSGHGVGLSAVRSMTRDLGGDTRILQRHPQGTRVAITVPADISLATIDGDLRVKSA
jgi:anti-sigma regulatory factor (Ser/Thr protein kinase)